MIEVPVGMLRGKDLLVDGDILKFAPSWLDSNGYWRCRNNAYLHRKIMENILGRSLTSKEQVHHIDENKSNNRADNLLVCSQAEHSEIHRRLDCIKAGFDPDTHKKCVRCKTYHIKSEFANWHRAKDGLSSSCRRSLNDWRRRTGYNRNKWDERAKYLQQLRRAKAKARRAEEGRSL